MRETSSALIVVHNHPSGDPTPSPDDIAVTKDLIEAGKLLDHIVVGGGQWVSMKQQRPGFR